MRVLVTGANGFVGSRLAGQLGRTDHFSLACAVRTTGTCRFGEEYSIGELGPKTDWSAALRGQDVVVHLAARAHVMVDEAPDPLVEYRRVNVDGTLNLARQAIDAGVRRFVFVSSIKVNGEQTDLGQPFTSDQMTAPADAYGVSKLEAERGLLALGKESGMEVVIIRPPLVYGPGVKGNFATLIKLVEKGIPLPLGAISNKRTLVSLDNLVDLIQVCIDHPAAANEVFLAGDNRDLSTSELLREVGKAVGKPARLIPVPQGLLMVAARLLGKTDVARRLFGSLQVDISKARNLLGWEPPVSVEEGLRRCFELESRS